MGKASRGGGGSVRGCLCVKIYHVASPNTCAYVVICVQLCMLLFADSVWYVECMGE